MSYTKPRSRYRHPWKHGALLLILLSHAVFGSPVVPASSSFSSVSSFSDSRKLTADNVFTPLEEDAFGPTLEKRADRKKRFLYEALKKAKQQKLLTIAGASGSMIKQAGKSVLKTVATLGLKAIIFNFLYTKINQVLDFKTRLLNNLEHKNRDQNSQTGISDSGTAGSTVSSTTENSPAS